MATDELVVIDLPPGPEWLGVGDATAGSTKCRSSRSITG